MPSPNADENEQGRGDCPRPLDYQVLSISMATKPVPPWLRATNSRTLVLPPFLASATPVWKSPGERTMRLPTRSTTSPGCKPLSAASLSGSTLVMTAPTTTVSAMLKFFFDSGVSDDRPSPAALALDGASEAPLGELEASCCPSGRVAMVALICTGLPCRETLKVATWPVGTLATRRVRSVASST